MNLFILVRMLINHMTYLFARVYASFLSYFGGYFLEYFPANMI